MFNLIQGDIFKQQADAVCITTNGNIRSDGRAVMGAGIAKTFRDLFPTLDLELAESLRTKGNICTVLRQHFNGVYIIAFPTKHNWRDNSSLELIKQSAIQLIEIADSLNLNKILLPKPGCSNGRLDWNQVSEILKPILDNRIYVISK